MLEALDIELQEALRKSEESDKELGAVLDARSRWIESKLRVGELLVRGKAECKKLKRNPYEWAESRHGLKKVQVTRLIRIAVHKEQCRQLVAEGTATTIEKLQPFIPKADEPPAAISANPKRLGYVGTTPGAARNSDDWHTPEKYIESARLVMGSIGLDPFSSAQANGTVKARRYFTPGDDALTTPWAGDSTVWMNPPYGKLAGPAVDRFINQHDAGAFEQGVVLMNSSTDTRWCQALLNSCDAFCFTDHRISFNDAGGKAKSGNTKGQVFFYFGKNAHGFVQEFGRYGFVMATGLIR